MDSTCLDIMALSFPAFGAILVIWDQSQKGRLTILLGVAILLIYWGFAAGMLSKYFENSIYFTGILLLSILMTLCAIGFEIWAYCVCKQK
jgi:hypothetical protein